jgi:uncharacterized protein YjbI with pentapeptide repeats
MLFLIGGENHMKPKYILGAILGLIIGAKIADAFMTIWQAGTDLPRGLAILPFVVLGATFGALLGIHKPVHTMVLFVSLAALVSCSNKPPLVWLRCPPLCQGSELIKLDLRGKNFSFALITNATLGGSYLRGANLYAANLKRTNLNGANLEDANLKRANLTEASLRLTNLRNANLSGTNLANAYIRTSYMQGTIIDDTTQIDDQSRLIWIIVNQGRGQNLSKIDLSGVTLMQADLREADLSEANLSGANLSKAQLSKANLHKADLRGTLLRYADLSEADLSEANLGSDLPWTDLEGANLSNANLQKADLRRAQLDDALLYGADLSGANLSETILYGVDLAGAKYNSETQWYGSFDPETAGAVRIETSTPVLTPTPASIPIPTATVAPTSTPAPTSLSCPAVFSNPERGFYHFTETHSNNYDALDLNTLRRYRQCEGISLVHRSFYLDDFVTGPISQGYLDAMQRDFDTVREAGLKAIVRFAYTNGPDLEPPYGDASKERILSHIQQLSLILQANSDVIATLQAGFIGLWGEWWYSDYFIPDGDWYARRDVLFALLDALPSSRMVQLRAPRYKQNIFNTTLAVRPSEAHSGTNLARTGHHNDCFLSSASDYGTYIDPPSEYPYLEEDTKYVVMGGETCDPSFADDPAPERLKCQTALEELARFHWSFLNIDWYKPTLQSWRDDGCFAEIEQRLGYRFALVQRTFPDQARLGDSFQFSLQLENQGFAAPFNPRAVELILRGTDGTIYTFELPDDPRFWLPGEPVTISNTLSMPLSLPAGDYELLLNLPDPEPALRHRPEYAIRLADGGDWEEATGYNRLNHTLVVLP